MKCLGTNQLASAEDIVQDTFVKAFEQWKLKGLPDKPVAWLLTVARNKTIDLIRKNNRDKKLIVSSENVIDNTIDYFNTSLESENQFDNDQLSLLFICCNPVISEESQIALVLKIFCGFNTREISRALRTNEDTIQKRIYRARKILQENNLAFVLPKISELQKRLVVVHRVTYLIFNEGYHSGNIGLPIREELVEDAMRLVWQLSKVDTVAQGDTFALLALFCFHASRLYGRVNEEGLLLDFKNQDRTKWNYDLIKEGKKYLLKAIQLKSKSTYLPEAAISYEYCLAKNYSEINWEKIVKWYDVIISIQKNEKYFLQKIIVLGEMHGAEFGINELVKFEQNYDVDNNFLFHLTKAKWHVDLNQVSFALNCFDKAITLTDLPAERAYIRNKISLLEKRKSD